LAIELNGEADLAEARVRSDADDEVVHLADASLCGAVTVIGTAKAAVRGGADNGTARPRRCSGVAASASSEAGEPAGAGRLAFALAAGQRPPRRSAAAEAHSASAAASPIR
jgi:hypothetical protein